MKLIYLTPFVLPFVLLGQARLLWWLAGAEVYDPNIMASICLTFGFIFGIFAIAYRDALE